MTMKKVRYCCWGSHWYMAVREIRGKARSTREIMKAQMISNAKSRRWGRK